MKKILLLIPLLCASLCSPAFGQAKVGGTAKVGGVSTIGVGSGTVAIAFVSAASNSTNASPTAVTLSPTAGNRIVLDVWSTNATGFTVSDNGATGGSTYTANGSGYTTAASVLVKEYEACAIPSGVTTITVVTTGTVSSVDVIARQYSGGSCAADVAFSTGLVDISQTVQTGNTITPASGFNEIVSVCSIQVTNDTTNFATSGLYTNRVNQADIFTNNLVGCGDQLVTSTTSTYAGKATTTPTAVTSETSTSSYK